MAVPAALSPRALRNSEEVSILRLPHSRIPYDPRKTPTQPGPLTVPNNYAPSNRPVIVPANITSAQSDEDTTFRETPGYDFRFGEGQRAVENSAIARGGLLSGRALKDLTRFGQDYGAAEYQNVFNRRASIAGITPPVVSNLNAMGANYANSIGNINQNLGAGLSSSYQNMAGSLNDSFQGGMNNYLFYQYMQPPYAGGGNGGAFGG